MQIIVGKTAGFCPGVKRAVEGAKKSVNPKETWYCLGDLAHNERVISMLKEQGLQFVETVEEIPDGSAVIFRSHGVSEKMQQDLIQKGCRILDLTCPSVLAIHKLAKNYQQQGYYILLVGEHNHPEAIATATYCGNQYAIVQSKEDLEETLTKIKEKQIKDVAVIAQTTFHTEQWKQYLEQIKHDLQGRNLVVKNTICNATNLRQEETIQIAKQVDCMIVIGGKKSANTYQLYQLAKEYTPEAILIQGIEDLEEKDIQLYETVGVMAGASTPQEAINEVINWIKGG